MKETKFRVWDKGNNKWFKPTYEAYRGDLEYLVVGLDGSLSMMKNGQMLHESTFLDRFEKAQYTGLKDKNGKEIYEGDILDSEVYPFHDEGKSNYLAEICWDNGSASFFGYMYLRKEAGERKSGIAEGNTVDAESFSSCEVIGNIYENPDLLTE